MNLGKPWALSDIGVQINQLSINLWVWGRPVDFRIEFPLWGFCVFTLCQNFWLRMSWYVQLIQPTWKDVVTAHLFNIIFTTYFILFNTIHKMGRYEFWCYLKWYNYMWTGDLLTIHFSYSNSYVIIVIGRVICFRNTKNYNFQLNISNSYFVSTILISLVWA